MPHLQYCNRYWHVAGDELSVPAICSITGRIFWTILISILFGVSYDKLDPCHDSWILQTYLLASIILFALTIFCDAKIIQTSLKGTIIDSRERNKIGQYLTLKFSLTSAESICAFFGVISLGLGSDLPCNEDVEGDRLGKAFVALVVASQLIDTMFLFCCCYCLRSGGKDKESIEEHDQILALWQNRCQSLVRGLHFCLCNVFGGGNIEEGFEEVAKVLTNFFHHDDFLDVVPSDVVAGILLVRVEQRARKRRYRIPNRANSEVSSEDSSYQKKTSKAQFLKNRIGNNEPETAYSNILLSDLTTPQQDLEANNNSNDILSQFSIQEIECWLRCSVYAVAIYTHIMVLYMNPCTGCCRLCCGTCYQLTCSGCLPQTVKNLDIKKEMLIEGDNYCKLNDTGINILKKYLKNTELIHMSFKNDTTHKPYAVFLDHEKEWVVIALRGTLSLEDCITDAMCDPMEMDEIGSKCGIDGKNRWAHGGMLKAAYHVYNELDRHKLLQKIFGSNIVSSNMTTPLTNGSGYSHYNLVVTGHSLGAGTAVILTWLLKAKFPNIKCYSFGTPASVLDEASSREVAPFVSSIVWGNDLVCRLSFHSLCHLRNDVLDTISRAKVNKMVIMRSIFKDYRPEDLLFNPGQEPDSEFKTSVKKFRESIQGRLEVFSGKELKIPGRIIHFVKVKNELPHGCCDEGPPRLFPILSSSDKFTEIAVSTTMGTDHLPDRYFYGIQRLHRYVMQGGYIA